MFIRLLFAVLVIEGVTIYLPRSGKNFHSATDKFQVVQNANFRAGRVVICFRCVCFFTALTVLHPVKLRSKFILIV